MIHASEKEILVAEIVERAHHLVSGLSPKLGGKDEGLDPHELLESALAACTILTARLYAQRKGMNLEGMDVEIKILKEGPETELSRKVTFKGPLSAEDKDRLTAIVNKCPIHRLLESQVHIQTTIEA